MSGRARPGTVVLDGTDSFSLLVALEVRTPTIDTPLFWLAFFYFQYSVKTIMARCESESGENTWKSDWTAFIILMRDTCRSSHLQSVSHISDKFDEIWPGLHQQERHRHNDTR